MSIINVDAAYAGRFLQETADTIMTYGIGPGGQIRAQDIRFDRHGSQFLLKMPSQSLMVKTRLFGEFNVVNTLCAIAILVSQKIPLESIPDLLKDFP